METPRLKAPLIAVLVAMAALAVPNVANGLHAKGVGVPCTPRPLGLNMCEWSEVSPQEQLLAIAEFRLSLYTAVDWDLTEDGKARVLADDIGLVDQLIDEMNAALEGDHFAWNLLVTKEVDPDDPDYVLVSAGARYENTEDLW